MAIKTLRMVHSLIIVPSPFANHPTNRLTQEVRYQLASAWWSGRQGVCSLPFLMKLSSWSSLLTIVQSGTQLVITPICLHNVYASYSKILNKKRNNPGSRIYFLSQYQNSLVKLSIHCSPFEPLHSIILGTQQLSFVWTQAPLLQWKGPDFQINYG